MTISVVQTATQGAFQVPPFSFGSNVTAGNTVLLYISAYHAGAGTITTSAPTLGGSPVTGSTAFFNSGSTNGINSALAGDGVVSYSAIWMLPNCPGGSKALSWSASGHSGFVGCFALEVSGLGTSPVLDQSVPNSGTSGSASTGSTGSIVTAPEIILAVAALAENYSSQPGAPWTVVSPSAAANGGWQIATSSGGNYSWSQTASNNGAWTAGIVTVAASLPTIPAPVYPQQRPAQAKRLPLRGGRIAANAGGPVANPNFIAVYGAAPGAARAALPFAPRGRIRSSPGIPVPPPNPIFFTVRGISSPVRAALPFAFRGRVTSNQGAPVRNPPPPGPPFAPFRQAVHIRFTLPPRGRTASGAGAPVRNPAAGPVFAQAVHPARARIPQNAPRGRAAGSAGGTVVNQRRILVTAGDPFTAWDTGSLLTFQP